MLKCKEIATILSSDEHPHGMRRFQFRLHLMMCKHCKRFEKQIRALSKGLIAQVDLATEKSEADLTRLEQEVIRRESKG